MPYLINLVPPPCDPDCEKRSFDCHAHCKEYAEYQEKCEAERQKRAHDSEFNAYISGVIKRMPGKRHI